MMLEPEQEALLAEMVQAARSVPRHEQKFFVAEVDQGAFLIGADLQQPVLDRDIRALLRAGLIEESVRDMLGGAADIYTLGRDTSITPTCGSERASRRHMLRTRFDGCLTQPPFAAFSRVHTIAGRRPRRCSGVRRQTATFPPSGINCARQCRSSPRRLWLAITHPTLTQTLKRPRTGFAL